MRQVTPFVGRSGEMKMDKNTRKDAEHVRPIRPNMMMLNADGRSSTLARTDFSHSVLSEMRLFNSRVHQSNLEGCAFDDCDLDGSTFSGCSFRGVQLINCDVDHMTINGVNVGSLMHLLSGPLGGKHG
jgi:uncharacterized protein YjbI with pentapeptide repeats